MGVAKLNQVVAAVSGKKDVAKESITKAYHTIQKPTLFDGIAKTYDPKDENGDKLPPESKQVQSKVSDLVAEVSAALTEMIDVVATQDFANCSAKADVMVNGEVLIPQVPVTHLMFLEKQVKDLETFINKLPTLDPAESWDYNQATDQYSTSPKQTERTKKIPRAFVKYEATEKHPAQVDTYNEDIVAGYWTTIKYSGAISAKEKNQMLERVRRLHEGILKAREEANMSEAPNVSLGKRLLKFVFNQ